MEFTIYHNKTPFEFVNKQTVLISEEGKVIIVLDTNKMDERFMVKDTGPCEEEKGE